MNRQTGNWYFAFSVLCVVSLMAGCRHGSGANGLYGNTRVQPPPTNWTAADSYYNPLATAQNRNGLISTNGKAPTAAPAPNSLGAQTGQRQPVGASANPGYTTSGVSYTQSTNYQTTSIDERFDQTRVPLTDATAVKAPVQSVLPPVLSTVSRQNPYGSNAAFPDPIGTARTQPVASSGGNPIPYAGHPTFNQPAYATANSSNTVLAESTVRVNPNSPNYRAGWRTDGNRSDVMR
ncbi:MAG: hypothetical protein MK108_14520 [Mariniblastus sp.]|nr:hypothetical protein [Mariniblastus sp.]